MLLVAESSSIGFVAIHVGAGYHSKTKLPDYKALIKRVCRFGITLCKDGHFASHIASEVVSLLEESDLTNAGYGSNLTKNGKVQCDAGLMESSTSNFAAVGGIEGVKNPIRVAYELLQHQNKNDASLVPPMILVGEGAKQWAVEKGFAMVRNDQMISDYSLRTYEESLRILEKQCKSINNFVKDDIEPLMPRSQHHCKCKMIDKSGETLGFQSKSIISVDAVARTEPQCVECQCNCDKRKLNITYLGASTESKTCRLSNEKKGLWTEVKTGISGSCHEDHGLHNELNSLCNETDKPCDDEKRSFREVEGYCDEQNQLCHKIHQIHNLKSKVCYEMNEPCSKRSRSCNELNESCKTKSKSSLERYGPENEKNRFYYGESNPVNTNNWSCDDDAHIEEKLDTVGAICVDKYGNVCAAVSSGGLILKHAGRVGQAACYGCGCFVCGKTAGLKQTICASSTSGCGEQLIKTLLAKHCVDTLLANTDMLGGYCNDNNDNDVPESSKREETFETNPDKQATLLDSGFLKSKYLRNVEKKLAGCINVRLMRELDPATEIFTGNKGCSEEENFTLVGEEIRDATAALGNINLISTLSRVYTIPFFSNHTISRRVNFFD